jgi:putative membrane protein
MRLTHVTSAAAITALAATAAHAHGAPTPRGGWAAEPVAAAGVVLTAVLYAAGVARLWRASGVGRGVPFTDVAWFAGGWLALAVALVSPLHPIGQVLFSAHMGQHELLMLVAAPMLVLGRPGVPLLWALPATARRTIGRGVRARAWRRTWAWLTRPLVAWTIHLVALWAWHVPALFEATLRSETVHFAQHASFFGSALLFWWALVHAPRTAAGFGVALLATFTTAAHSGLLGALLTFARTVWYPSYVATAPRFGLTPLEDQQLGGLVMWVPAGLLYVVAGGAFAVGWLRASERAVDPHARRRAVGVALVLLLLAGCTPDGTRLGAAITGGDPARGRALLAQYGCETCHTIPGVPGAQALVGPPLERLANRSYLAGSLPNTPANLMRWIREPRELSPRTAMPDLGVGEEDARDMAAYLYALR